METPSIEAAELNAVEDEVTEEVELPEKKKVFRKVHKKPERKRNMAKKTVKDEGPAKRAVSFSPEVIAELRKVRAKIELDTGERATLDEAMRYALKMD